MNYEVEFKFPLSDPQRIATLCEELNARRGDPLRQIDTYFSHPQRDFAETDEALRIRSVGEGNCITYKGPKLDPLSKTRREMEIPIAAGATAAQGLAEILNVLGFSQVATVSKTRTPFHLQWESHAVELAVDEVDGLGTFVELETQAAETERDAARDALLRLARRLGLDNSQRKSYLCLLLETQDS